MSDALFSLDQRKTLAEIDELYASTHKLLIEATKMTAEAIKLSVETTKVSAEAVKLNAETTKMDAETIRMKAEADKLRTDARFAGWQVAFAGFTAGALVIGAIVTAMKVLGV